MELFKTILIWYLGIGIPIALVFTIIAYYLRNKKVTIGWKFKQLRQLNNSLQITEAQVNSINKKVELKQRINVEQLQIAEQRITLLKEYIYKTENQPFIYVLIGKKEPKTKKTQKNLSEYDREFAIEMNLELNRLREEDKVFITKQM